MTKPVINIAQARTHTESVGEHFSYSMTPLARAAGAKTIGTNLTHIPPGKAGLPFHHHYSNEEHFFIVSGAGVLRTGDDTYDVEPNDYIVCLPGGPELAHQLINTGSVELVFLAISTQTTPEVVGYPDSGKTGVRPESLNKQSGRFLISDASRGEVSYWENEDGKQVAEIIKRR